MKTNEEKILDVISILNHIEIDGETMQHVIDQTGMRDQMLRQLVLSSPTDKITQLLEEKQEIESKLCDETLEPKEFLITETYPVTVTKKYRVTAVSEEEAEMKMLEEDILPFWINQKDDLGEMEVDIKPYVEEQN